MSVLKRLMSRFRRPAFLGWGGDYTADLMFSPLWEPDPRGEVR